MRDSFHQAMEILNDEINGDDLVELVITKVPGQDVWNCKATFGDGVVSEFSTSPIGVGDKVGA